MMRPHFTNIPNIPKPKSVVQPLTVPVQAKLNEAIALHQKGLLKQAQAIYEEVLETHPQNCDALHLLGVIASQFRNHQLAADLMAKAIAVNPNDAVFYNNRGNVLKELKQMDAAIGSYDKAIRIKPDYAEAYINRGVVLKELNQLEAAVSSYEKAIRINPQYAEAYCYRGVALKQLKQLEEAVSCYDKALSIKPDYPEAYLNKSLALLLSGDLGKAWPLFEWRWKEKQLDAKRRHFSQPLWLGTESLDGKTILLYSEQGLGDSLQFCRYAKMVAALGARVVAEVPKSLVGLLRELEGISEIIEKGSVLPAFDFHCPLLSLPLAFKTNLSNMPSSQAYLRSDSDKVAVWSSRLGAKTKPRIGLVWSGSPTHKNDHNRSIALSTLMSYLPSKFEYVSLQKDVRDSDKAVLEAGASLKHFGKDILDFTDTAALCSVMDLVISVDTSVAHLSGALGQKTWVMLPYVPDWRWLLDRDDSPWYTSAKLYRQNADCKWDTVLDKVSTDLLQFG